MYIKRLRWYVEKFYYRYYVRINNHIKTDSNRVYYKANQFKLSYSFNGQIHIQWTDIQVNE